MDNKEIEKNILNLEEDFRDTIENEIIKNNNKNKQVEIKDVKYVGEASWKDKVNGKDLSDKVFIVELEITEIDKEGKERKTQKDQYYLGDKCVGGTLGDDTIIYNPLIENSEPDKIKAVNDLLDKTPEEEIENNSMNKLQKEELAEVLSAHYGREVKEEEVEQLLEEMDAEETEELKEEKEENKDKDENDLSEKQTEKIKVNGLQKVDLNKKVDGKETLGKRLDLEGFEDMYVIYSDKVDNVTAGTKRENTTYSLVGVTKDGDAKVLNNEFEMDKFRGTSGTTEQTKIRANSTATRDNRDSSVFTRKSNGASIGCENDQGNVNMFFYQRTLEENENVGIQIETSQTQVIPVETKEVMNRNRGRHQVDRIRDEVEEHEEHGCKPDDVKDFDGYENTETHEHVDIEVYVDRVYNYQNQYGEEKIQDVFTKNEVRDKIKRELINGKDKIPTEKVIENVEKEMNADAEMMEREHNRR